MFQQAKIERHRLTYLVMLISAWTAFGLFFGTQGYVRAIYFGQPASLPGYIFSWIICGYSWGILTVPAVLFIRRFSLQRLEWSGFVAVHILASVVFSAVQLFIYLIVAGVLFRASERGMVEFYKFLLANELQSSILVYVAIVSVVTVKEHFFGKRATHGAEPSGESKVVNTAEAEVLPNGHANGFLRRISLKDNGRIFLLDSNKIYWIESYGNYLFLHTPERKFIYRETMAAMEKRLDPYEFVRIRRSAIVKIDQIREFHPIENGEFEIVLLNGEILSSTRRYKKNLESILRP
jgi:hypothetical protein